MLVNGRRHFVDDKHVRNSSRDVFSTFFSEIIPGKRRLFKVTLSDLAVKFPVKFPFKFYIDSDRERKISMLM